MLEAMVHGNSTIQLTGPGAGPVKMPCAAIEAVASAVAVLCIFGGR